MERRPTTLGSLSPCQELRIQREGANKNQSSAPRKASFSSKSLIKVVVLLVLTSLLGLIVGITIAEGLDSGEIQLSNREIRSFFKFKNFLF